MRGISIATASAWAAHAMAWAAGGWLAFAPAYQGASQTASLPGEPAGEIVRHTSTLIEQNGLQVVPLLLAPIVLTAIALLALRLTNDRPTDAEGAAMGSCDAPSGILCTGDTLHRHLLPARGDGAACGGYC